MTSTRVSRSEVDAMMAELDAIAAERGIVWGAAEQANTDTSERSHYKRPGTVSGRGITRLVSAKQVAFIKKLLASRDTAKLVRLPGSENIERMSLAGARDLIERLLACPELPVSVVAPEHASDKQVAFITSLVSQREGAQDTLNRLLSVLKVESVETLPRKLTSGVIDALKALPFAARKPLTTVAQNVATPVNERVDGMYRKDGETYKVQFNRTHTNAYVKHMVSVDSDGKPVWEYQGGFTRSNLTAADKMTLEAAKEFGALYGTCINCGRTLTDEKSIDAGIGPVCIKAFA